MKAVSTGRAELLRIGHQGPALVLACDLPLLDVAVLRLLGDSGPVMLDESDWSEVAGAAIFADVDVPSDLAALDLEIESGGG